MAKVREFITHREPDEHIWVHREQEHLVGTVRAGQRTIPRIQVFDLLRGLLNSQSKAEVLVWEGSTVRIAAECTQGQESQLTRAADYDTILFQFSGSSAIDTEYGSVKLEPGESLLIPAGISQRSLGEGECLRLRIMVREALELGVDPDKPVTESNFRVRSANPFIAASETRRTFDDGKTLEHLSFWEPVSDLWIERDPREMVGCVINGGRGVRKLRVFDYFTGITGTPGVKLPVPYKGKGFRVDVYNLEGPQLVGFHRGCDEDEIHFQFRGSGINETEWGITELTPGEMSFIPRGVGHRTTGSKGFLRMVFYSRELVHPKAFNPSPSPQTAFEVQ